MSRLVRLPLRAPLFAKLLVVVLLAAGAAAALAAQPARDDAAAPAPPANPGRGEVVSLSDGPGTPAPVAHVRDPEESLSHPDPAAAQDGPKAKAPHVAGASSDDGVSPGAPSDEEVREMLREMREGGGGPAGRVTLTKDGLARVPSNAPQAVRAVIAGGNAIADFPYIWGGGHGSFEDSGYDCSGSVSYALAAGGLLKAPMASGNFMKWGEEGRGKWITIYSNPGHMFMVVGGLRFDTSGRSGSRGSRWQAAPRSFGGFVARHPPGL
jgi:cell wall-associated NlpC family hydrolase